MSRETQKIARLEKQVEALTANVQALVDAFAGAAPVAKETPKKVARKRTKAQKQNDKRLRRTPEMNSILAHVAKVQRYVGEGALADTVATLRQTLWAVNRGDAEYADADALAKTVAANLPSDVDPRARTYAEMAVREIEAQV